ncbi:hypothetical protein HPB50_016766 [Hyalomma asiaticum]|uniref:Uncharacterized protein n=1 Tax=Hyalomma asiaticum TaxID=266040 RepID=A0ACB7SXF0_HYAAI|nr:hypothetical protein HPB50_016766 [Hyalomma asiaticum]
MTRHKEGNKAAVVSVKHIKELRLLRAGYGVLCQQISSWVLYGILHDPHEEFFVQELCTGPPQTERNTTSSCLEAPVESMQDFCLKSNLLPDQLSQSFASKVLFAGAAVRVFGQSMEKPVYNTEQEAEFLDRLQKISESPEIDLFQLEVFVEDVRSAAAAHLWQLFVEEGCLLFQLRLLRDAFLLGRGELFLHFSQVAEHILCEARKSTTEQNVNVIFQQACSLLQSEDENLAEQFRITIGPTASQDGSQAASACWETIGLNYKVKPPLHVFFTPAIMSKYNRLFRLLFGLQRAQTFLQECWVLQCKAARTGPLHNSDLMRRMMQLRAEMAHLLDSLQYYLQEFRSNKLLLIKVLSSLHNKLSETQPSQLLVRLDPGCVSARATN